MLIGLAGSAQLALEHCRQIARFSDETEATTRTFLGPAMRDCLNYFQAWADRIGLSEAGIDAAGNFRASLPGSGTKRLVLGSHLDTVPNAGAFDGVLGVVIAMLLAEYFRDQPPLCTIEIVGFSEEEGVRFRQPFLGSIAFVNGLSAELAALEDSEHITVTQAIRDFGLDPEKLAEPQMDQADAYLEFHIEQGPMLESLSLPLGIVEAIAGQTRATFEFRGRANHAGTTPMRLRHDALCAAAEWVLAVERLARNQPPLVATVGHLHLSPNATNVVPGMVSASLDLRHPLDAARNAAFTALLQSAQQIAIRRQVSVHSVIHLQQPSVPLQPALLGQIEDAFQQEDLAPHRMTSGAGHDAMILAGCLPAALIFLRSPSGISHHPDENVLTADVAAALRVGIRFVQNFG